MKLVKSRLFRIIYVIFCVLAIVGLSRSVYSLWRRGDVIKARQEELTRLEAKNRQFKRELEEAESPEFIEREARDKLGLAKSGETVVFMEQPATSPAQTAESVDKPNWKQWWDLFF